MKPNTCCFIGQRSLPPQEMERMFVNLNEAIDALLHQGVTNFICAGAPGFDMVAASLVIAKKEMGNDARLIFALPGEKQENFHSKEHARLFRDLIKEADEIRYAPEAYSGQGKTQDFYMLDQSAFCVCYMLQAGTEMLHAIEYAHNAGVTFVNVAFRWFALRKP